MKTKQPIFNFSKRLILPFVAVTAVIFAKTFLLSLNVESLVAFAFNWLMFAVSAFAILTIQNDYLKIPVVLLCYLPYCLRFRINAEYAVFIYLPLTLMIMLLSVIKNDKKSESKFMLFSSLNVILIIVNLIYLIFENNGGRHAEYTSEVSYMIVIIVIGVLLFLQNGKKQKGKIKSYFSYLYVLMIINAIISILNCEFMTLYPSLLYYSLLYGIFAVELYKKLQN